MTAKICISIFFLIALFVAVMAVRSLLAELKEVRSVSLNPDPNEFTINTSTYPDTALTGIDLIDTSVWDTAPNISFCIGDFEILFEWTDGKFNVVYDPNRCTESAKTFFDCMLPYLNEHIEERARDIAKSLEGE